MDFGDLLYNIFWVSLYVIILIVFLFGLISFVFGTVRRKSESKFEYNLTFLQIKLPQENEIEIENAEQMFSGLMSIRKSFFRALLTGQHRISFEIVSKSEGIGFYVVVPDDMVTMVEKQINGAYPEAEIDIIDPNEVWDRGQYTSVVELKLAGPPYYPIKTYNDLGSDPLNSITSSMSKLSEDEVVALQYIIRPASDSWRQFGRNFIGKIKVRSADPNKSTNIDTSFLEGVEKKIGKSGFDISIRVIAISKDKYSTETHINNVFSAFGQFTDPTYNSFRRKGVIFKRKLIYKFIYRKLRVVDWHIPLLDIPFYRNTSVLNIEELATVFHFPNKNVQTPNIVWLLARKSAAPINLPESGMYLGKSVFRGVEKRIYLKEEDRRRHMYIIGQTGTGKSEFLKFMAIQDIKDGKGLAVVDPHGSDIDDILPKIPKERVDDVILFDVSDTERPLGLNILEADTEEQRNILINAFIALLYKLYDPNRQGIMGPQLERTIRNVMLTVMVDKESTVIDVLRLLIDTDYAKKFLPNVSDPLVRRYWTDEIAKTSDFHKSEKMGYMVSKFDRFVTDHTMRNIIGQPKSAIDFGRVMAERKILLVDLSKGKIGEENSSFLGLLLVPRILMAAMGRASVLGKEEFPDFYLYVDEFQNFATPDFATILSEARKYKLNLVVANQFIAQLTDEIKGAVFGNVGSLAAFRVGADDAEYMETHFKPTFVKNDLMNNPVGSLYMRLLVDGQPTVPFSMKVDWDEVSRTEKSEEIANTIREKSRQAYGTPIQEVEKYINLRAGFEEQEKPDIIERLRGTVL